MKTIVFVFVIAAFFVLDAKAQKVNGLYVRDTGSVDAPCILFLHGGPGYNCWTFEAAMTDTLLASGYRVITFDQRGCGRSDVADRAEYTFAKALSDIDTILARSGVKRFVLIGHSFGGTLAMKWAESHKNQVSAMLLIGSPLSYPNTFSTIRQKMAMADTLAYPGLGYSIKRMEDLDTASIEYVGSCFQWAMKLGAYSVIKPSEVGKNTKKRVFSAPDKKWSSNMTQAPFLGFLANESYAKLDLTNDASACLKMGYPVQLLIGDDDGLFDNAHRAVWENVLGTRFLTRVPQSSHTVFVDRPDVVLEAILGITGR